MKKVLLILLTVVLLSMPLCSCAGGLYPEGDYVDANGNPLLESTYFNFDAGEHPVFPLPVDGYAVIEPSMQTVFVDRDGANPPEITFVYEREVQPVTVIIHYVDQNGEPLRADEIH